MNPEKSPRRVVKATLEAVFLAQERLRKHLDVLIEDDRCLNDTDERDIFMREMAYSTLGLGTDHKIQISVPDHCGLRKDVETIGRWLAYQNSNMVYVPMELFDRNYHISGKQEPKIPIRVLWTVLRDNLFSIFPLALDKAASMSKERDETSKGKGYVIDEQE
jgi:hypothetical protein